MCIFKKKPSNNFYSATHKALLFAINDYPGRKNDLRGCINDAYDRSAKIMKHWPHFAIRMFLDSDATIATFVTECEKAIASMAPGSIVVVSFDSCFSSTATRNDYQKARFLDPGLPPRRLARRISSIENMKWLAYSACLDNQTASDAYIGGRYNGVFTFYDMMELRPGITYNEHIKRIKMNLPSKLYSQIPGLEGPDHLKNEIIFKKPTLFIAFSGHGTYDYAKDSGEEDGMDEAIVLHDGILIDNEINRILQKIV